MRQPQTVSLRWGSLPSGKKNLFLDFGTKSSPARYQTVIPVCNPFLTVLVTVCFNPAWPLFTFHKETVPPLWPGYETERLFLTVAEKKNQRCFACSVKIVPLHKVSCISTQLMQACRNHILSGLCDSFKNNLYFGNTAFWISEILCACRFTSPPYNLQRHAIRTLPHKISIFPVKLFSYSKKIVSLSYKSCS